MNAAQFKKMSLKHQLEKASPYELIQILLHNALHKIELAKYSLTKQNLTHKVVVINQAINIIESLNSSLNHEIGKEISYNLNKLYDFIVHNLIIANAKNDIDYLNKAEKSLQDIKDIWDTINPNKKN